MMIDIEVRLFAALQHNRFRRKQLAFPQGSTVTDVLDNLAIAPGEVAILMVNGVAAARNHALCPGDTVSLFPAIGGG